MWGFPAEWLLVLVGTRIRIGSQFGPLYVASRTRRFCRSYMGFGSLGLCLLAGGGCALTPVWAALSSRIGVGGGDPLRHRVQLFTSLRCCAKGSVVVSSP